MKKNLLVLICLISATTQYQQTNSACCGRPDPAPAQPVAVGPQPASLHATTQLDTNKPLNRAKRIINRFYAIIKRHHKQEEFSQFSEYLKYYRSEGGFQAVSPAPRQLRDTLSAHALELFEKIKKLAHVYLTTPQPVPGASKLSPDGEKFYQELIKHTQELLKKA